MSREKFNLVVSTEGYTFVCFLCFPIVDLGHIIWNFRKESCVGCTRGLRNGTRRKRNTLGKRPHRSDLQVCSCVDDLKFQGGLTSLGTDYT